MSIKYNNWSQKGKWSTGTTIVRYILVIIHPVTFVYQCLYKNADNLHHVPVFSTTVYLYFLNKWWIFTCYTFSQVQGTR